MSKEYSHRAEEILTVIRNDSVLHNDAIQVRKITDPVVLLIKYYNLVQRVGTLYKARQWEPFTLAELCEAIQCVAEFYSEEQE